MNEITLTATLCEEDRKRIDALIVELHELNMHATHVPQSTPQERETEPVKEITEPAKKASENEPQSPAPWDKDAPDMLTKPMNIPAVAEEPPAVKYSREDIQQKVVSLAATGKKAEVKGIVNLYAERVSTIPEDKLGEVMVKLIALEG